MAGLTVLPDVEHLTIEYLARVPELVPLIGGAVSTAAPSSPPKRYLTLAQLGGVPTGAPDWLVGCRLQLDAWATKRADASHLARVVRAALRAAGNWRHRDGQITSVRVVQEPAWRPDTSRTPPTPRFSMTVDVFAHP